MPFGKCMEVLDRKDHVDLKEHKDMLNRLWKTLSAGMLGTFRVPGAIQMHESISRLFRVQEGDSARINYIHETRRWLFVQTLYSL